MEEENVHTWRELLQSETPIYSAIFGFQPVLACGIPEDKFLIQANCIPFGIIPMQLEN